MGSQSERGRARRALTKRVKIISCRTVDAAEGRKGPDSESSGSKLESRCKLPQETGPCRAAFQKFHFDSESGTCKEFIYGGCDGNENRFDSKEDCLRACQVWALTQFYSVDFSQSRIGVQ